MSSEESLGPGKDMSDDNCRTQGVNDVLIIGVEQQAIISVAWESNNGVDLKVFLHDRFDC